MLKNNDFRVLVETTLPTKWGMARIIAFGDNEELVNPYIALIYGEIDELDTVHVRIHSECFTGDVFGSQKCECGDQLSKACQIISKEGGVLIYEREEGRGIGLVNKLKAYQLQNLGYDTAKANTELGFNEDLRDYQKSISILKILGITSVKLLTNNPLKIKSLEERGIKVERIELEIEASNHNLGYLKTKKDHFGHFLNL